MGPVRRGSDSRSGQVVLIGAMAILLLGVSVFAGIRYIGPKVTLHQQRGAAFQSKEIIQRAIRAFVARNYRLPCPADGTVAQGSATDGVENCAITGASGVVPWRSLGLSYGDSIDGWNDRIAYAVSPGLSNPADNAGTGTNSSYYWTSASMLDGLNKINVETCSTSCSGPTPYAYALISFGSDRAGAYQLNGKQISPPAATLDEYPNTQSAAFNTSGTFEVWPFNTATGAGNSYFDDSIVYEKSSQLCQDLNFNSKSSTPYCNTSNNPNAPSQGNQNTDAGAQAANSGTITNNYSCGAGSSFCPGSTNAGSLANTYSYSGCSGNVCTAPGNGNSLNLVGNLGTVSVYDPIFDSGISVGNSIENGDWVGPNEDNACVQCADSGTTQNYMIPGQELIYNLPVSYKSFAFVDYLVDGGMEVQVDGYQGQLYCFTGDIAAATANTITNVVLDDCTTGVASTAAPSTELAYGQSLINDSYFPSGTTITSVSGTTVTFSTSATNSGTSIPVDALSNSFFVTGDVTDDSTTINNISPSSNLSGVANGFSVTGPGIPAGATVTGISGTSITVSLSAFATQSGADLFVTPWVKAGTMILSNGNATNMNPSTTITGATTSGSTTVNYVTPSANLAVGQLIGGTGIVPGTTITAISAYLSGAQLTLSNAATMTENGQFFVATDDRVASPFTGTISSGTMAVSSASSTTGLGSGESIGGYGIPSATTVSSVTLSPASITLSNSATISTTASLFPATRQPITGITGTITSGSNVITNVTSTSGLVGGTSGDHVVSPALPSGTYITAVGTNTLTLSQNATASQTGATLYIVPLNPAVTITGTVTDDSNAITNVNSTTGLLPGEIIAAESGSGASLPSGTTITGISGTSLSVSLSATVSSGLSTNASLVVVKGTPLVVTVGDITENTNTITSVSPTTSLTVGQFISNPNLASGTTITAISGSTLTISQSASGTQSGATLTVGYTPPATNVSITGTLTSGSNTITGLPAAALPGGFGEMVIGNGIPAGTISAALSGTTMTLSQNSTFSGSESVHVIYPACPGPYISTLMSTAGLSGYGATSAYPASSFSPIVQHPSAAIAATIPSQIWPQPGTAGSGTTSAGSNPNALSGNYIDQRDNQFANLQFNDSNGNAIPFNVLVFQVLPYVYTNGQQCSAVAGSQQKTTGATCQYGMLFEGAKGCYNDIYTASCTMQGEDEWWNPPVAVTMDCGQAPL